MAKLEETIAKRAKIHQHVIDSLAHYEREQAMSIILSWFALDELESIMPVLAGANGNTTPTPHTNQTQGEPIG